jgi:hypothetical protein
MDIAPPIQIGVNKISSVTSSLRIGMSIVLNILNQQLKEPQSKVNET